MTISELGEHDVHDVPEMLVGLQQLLRRAIVVLRQPQHALHGLGRFRRRQQRL